MKNIRIYIHNAFFTHTSFILRRLPSVPSNVPALCNIPNAIFTNPKLFKHRTECKCTTTCKYNETNISLWKVTERRKKEENKQDPGYPP
jgi:hypothetical protein